MPRRLLSPDFNGTAGCPPSPYGPLIRDAAADILGCAPPVPSDRDNSSSSTPIELRRTSRHLYPLIVVSAALITAALLLSLFCLLRHLRRRRQLHELQQHHGPLVPPPPLPDGDDGPLPDDADQQHHVWLIRTVGLDDATIKAIAAWPYKASDGLIDGRDCAVCLGEFNDGELLKLLPKCSHAFHAPCIDTWLRSHVNCPLCRAPVLAPKVNTSPLPANVGSSNDSRTPEDTYVDDYTIHLTPQIPSHSENIHDLELDHGISDENREDLPAQGGCTSSIVVVPSDAGESALQPVRRSVSLDSFSLGVIVLRGEMAESDRVGKYAGEEVKEERSVGESIVKNKGKQGNASKGPCLQKGMGGMERSLSSSGRRLCLSRNRRANRNSSILPL